MLCWNGASSSRGLYVHDRSMLYIIRHSKARKTTNQEFQVARYLPAKDSVALAMYLIYIRPLADMIHRSCFGTRRDRKYLFSSVEDPDKHWKPSRLTAVLRKLTKDIAGLEFGVQVYRQLSIAVTERHLSHISKPFNRFDDKTADTDLDVALAWQSGHRPMQRGTSYGIDAAYPDSLQPALLRVYRRTSDIWHKFLDEAHDDNERGATCCARTDKGHDPRPRKRQRTTLAITHLRTPASCGTTLQSTQMNVGMCPPTADDTMELVSVRSATPRLAGADEYETLENLPRDSATALTPVSSMSVSLRVWNPTSIEEPPISTPAIRNDDQVSTRRLSAAPGATFARDQETRAGAELTDVDVFRQFEYLEDFKLLVCKSHGYAMQNVKRHLEERHRETKAVNRAATVRLTGLEIHDLRAVKLPAISMALFYSLSPPISGFFCGGEDGNCRFLSMNEQAMSRHWKTVHGSSKGRERLKHRKEVELQSFTPIKGHSRYFVVDSTL
jgi:hypothetical protein